METSSSAGSSRAAGRPRSRTSTPLRPRAAARTQCPVFMCNSRIVMVAICALCVTYGLLSSGSAASTDRNGRLVREALAPNRVRSGDLWPVALHRHKAGGNAGSGAMAILAFDGQGRLCYKKRMTATLSVRLPAEDKQRLFDAAARQGRSANDLVREAIRREVGATRGSSVSPLTEFFGSVDSAPPAPTNAAVRRSMRRGRK